MVGTRLLLLALALALFGLSGCGAAGGTTAEHAEAEAEFVKSIERPGADSVLVLMPNLPQTREIWRGLSDELGAEFSVIAYEVTPETSPSDVAKEIARVNPKCLVLMNNPTVKLYRGYQAAQPQDATFPPAVVVMTSFLEEQYHHVSNATGVSYEVPSVTLFTNLRSLVSRPVKRVGVVYRPMFKPYVARQRRLAQREQIQTVGEAVSAEPSKDELQDALNRLYDEQNIDALWVLNDNGLLSPELVARAWLPNFDRHKDVPVIVGTAALLSGDTPFGTFAMVPDHSALGVQSANLVFDIADNDWRIMEVGVQLPLSVRTVVNIKRAKKNFALREGALERIDHFTE